MVHARILFVLFSFLVISQPGSAAEIVPRHFHGTGNINDIDQSGSLVALATGYGVDLVESHAEGFTLLGHLDFDELAEQVVIAGNVLYVGVLRRGLYAVDISNPAAPVVHGLVTTTGGWRELGVTGDVIVGFTSGYGWNIFVGDLNDPLNPAAADSFSLENSQSGFALGDDHFYFVSSNDNLQTWSVANPYNPLQTGHYTTGNPRWTRVTVSGDLLWAHGENLTAFSLADPGDPAPVSQVDESLLLFPVATSFGSYLYRTLSADPSDLVVYDYSVAGSPAAVDTLDGVLGALAGTLAHADAGELMVASGSLLSRFDLTDPGQPVLDASRAQEKILDVAGLGNRAWLASGLAGLSCLDSNPLNQSLTWRGPWPQQGEVTKVAADGDRVALVDDSGVRLLDVSSPAAPVEIHAFAAEARDVDLAGDLLVFTAGASLQVVDLAGDLTPVSVALGGDATGVELARGHAFVLDSCSPVMNIDVTDPSWPHVVAPVFLPDINVPDINLLDFAADGDLLVISVFGAPDTVFDISDPANPVFLSHFVVDVDYIFELTRSVSLHGRWLLAGTGATTHLVDLGDPLNPQDVTGPVLVTSNVVDWMGGGLAITGGDQGVVLLELDSGVVSPAPMLRQPGLDLSLAPNPANPRVVVAWDLPRPGRVRVEVFDLAGRRVAGLVNEHRGQGPGTAAWDGRDDTGRGVASGVYLVSVRAGNAVESRHVTLVR